MNNYLLKTLIESVEEKIYNSNPPCLKNRSVTYCYVYNVFNSSDVLLSTFLSFDELKKYIKRHKRDSSDTKILVTVADSWNEVLDVNDLTKELMEDIWRKE